MRTVEAAERRGRLRERSPGVMAWLRLARVYALIDHETAELVRRHDLTVAQLDVIAQVGAHEGISQQELAAALLVTKGNVTQLIDRLEGRGLIERRQEPGRREKRLHLTDEGWRLNRAAVPCQEAQIARLMGALSDEEAATLTQVLRKLQRALEARRHDHDEEAM